MTVGNPRKDGSDANEAPRNIHHDYRGKYIIRNGIEL